MPEANKEHLHLDAAKMLVVIAALIAAIYSMWEMFAGLALTLLASLMYPLLLLYEFLWQ